MDVASSLTCQQQMVAQLTWYKQTSVLPVTSAREGGDGVGNKGAELKCPKLQPLHHMASAAPQVAPAAMAALLFITRRVVGTGKLEVLLGACRMRLTSCLKLVVVAND